MADQTVKSELKPWYESKINWTQAVGVFASVITLFGFTVPPDLIPQVVTGIASIQAVLTFIFRTWFNPTVTPQSAGVVMKKYE